jgi:hypothetical protein
MSQVTISVSGSVTAPFASDSTTSSTSKPREVLSLLKSTFSKWTASIEEEADDFKPWKIMSAIIQIAQEANMLLPSTLIIDFVKEIIHGDDHLTDLFKTSIIGSKFIEAAQNFEFLQNDDELQHEIDNHIIRAHKSGFCCF